jgi:hypothetical protein
MNPCNIKCPNYQPPKAKHYCSFCEDGIYDGEEYIVNNDNEYRHYECFYNTKDMLKWLGHEVKNMENEY